MKKQGFTLAEVLITLGIIGVVAAMTIPALISNARKKDYETGFQKAYSVLSQAIMLMKVDEGQVWANYNYQDNNGQSSWSITSFNTSLMRYMSVAKDCGTTCMPNENAYRNFSNTNSFGASGIMQKQFYTNDGMLISPVVYNSPNTLINIYVDVNGYNNKPNRAGYDIFIFQLLPDDRLVPQGAPNTFWQNYCDMSSSGTSSGYTCASRALTEKDYFKNLP